MWISKFKRKKIRRRMFTLSIPREIRQFHLVVGGVQWKKWAKSLIHVPWTVPYRHFRTEGKLGLVKFPKDLLGCFPFHENFRKFGNSGTWYRNLPEKFPDIPETVEFRKGEPFNRKFLKFREQSWMERKLPGKISRKSGYTSGGCPILGFHLLLEVAR